MIKAVIFGMNGVIYDSTPFMWEARTQYLKEQGVLVTEQDRKQLLGHSLKDQIRIINDKYRLNLTYEEFSEKTREIAKNLMKGNLAPNPGVRELIEDLTKHKLKIGIASLFPRKMLEEDLEAIGLLASFPDSIALEDADGSKGSSEMLMREVEKLRVKPEECVYVDDSIRGIDQAHGIGMKFIGKVTSFHKAEEFIGADLVVHSLEELTAEKILRLSEEV